MSNTNTINNLDYNSFLQSKLLTTPASGFQIDKTILPASMFEFQKDITKWCIAKGKAGVFASTGTGKSFIELAYANEIHKETNQPVLILTPLAVAAQHIREGKKFNIEARKISNNNEVFNGINITNYEKLHLFNPNQFSGVICDEGSIMKAFDSKTRNHLISLFPQTPYKLVATATPSPNDYVELGNYSEFLGIMSRVEMLSMFFVHDGGETSKWRLKKHAETAFWKWVSSWACFLRHPRDLGYEEKGFDLPPLHIEEKVVEVQCQNSLFPVDSMNLQERREARKNSLPNRCEIAADLVKNNPDKIWLIWCDLNPEGDLLEKLIPNSVQIAGRHSNEYKEEKMLDFADGKIKCLITKPSVAGFGLNWQVCHNMIFVGLGDSFELYHQSIRRCWRFGQKEQVNVYVITSTAEGAIVDNIKRKERDFNNMAEQMSQHTKEYVKNNLTATVAEKNEYKTKTVESKNGKYKLMMGDCVDRIKDIKDDSIDFSIFSPPFSSLYTYSNSDRDMGNCKSDKEFQEHFTFLAKEIFRVIKNGRLVSIHCMNLPTMKQKEGFIGLNDFRGDIIRLFQSVGFIYHSEVCIWKDPVIAMQRTKAIGLLYKQLKKDSTISRQGIPDYLCTFRKPGQNSERVTKDPEQFPVGLWQRYASPVWMDIDFSKTLQRKSAKEAKDERHIAPLQLQVIERAIDLWSNPNDLVFTPFLGIGSEVYQAIKMGRRGIGIELKESYFNQTVLNCNRAEEEMQVQTLFDLYGDDEQAINQNENQINEENNTDSELEYELPY